MRNALDCAEPLPNTPIIAGLNAPHATRGQAAVLQRRAMNSRRLIGSPMENASSVSKSKHFKTGRRARKAGNQLQTLRPDVRSGYKTREGGNQPLALAIDSASDETTMFFHGYLIALPFSLALWALIIAALWWLFG